MFLILTAACFAADEPLLLQQPALSKTHIVFVYAGDLWSVPRAGGNAIRLTSGTGYETDPAFSADGTQLAFTGEYDGNVDVFVMPGSGGVPKRLTWHSSSDQVQGWTPDGKSVIFTSSRTAFSRFSEMFSVPAEGGIEEKLPLPTGYEASFRRTDSRLPTDRSRGVLDGKNYRGAAPRASGSQGSPTAPLPRCRARTPTTSTRCGSATASTSCQTAAAR
jgi:tricorn protease